MCKKLTILIICFISAGVILYSDEVSESVKSINSADIFRITKYLSSEEMMGRMSGHEGFNRAANWIAGELKKYGLLPFYEDYRQRFNIDYNDIGDSSLILVSYKNDRKIETVLELNKDFLPELYTGFGEVEGEIVFAGYGITAPELNWDDYSGLNVKGKIVTVIAGPPSVDGKDFSKYWGPSNHKFRNAYNRGALALIRITSIIGVVGDKYIEGFPMLRLSEDASSKLFEDKGLNPEDAKKKLNIGEHLSFPTGIHAKIKTTGKHYDSAETFNIIARIEGSDPVLKNEYIILGAHLDHVGGKPVLFPGANDNASGSAVLLSLAEAFSKLKPAPKRTLVFAFFSAEERGGYGGSSIMVNNLPSQPARPIFMANFDAVGAGDRIVVAGATEFPELFKILTVAKKMYSINASLEAARVSGIYGQSDHGAFLKKGIPAYGTFAEGNNWDIFHTTKDSIYAIAPQIMEDIARLYFYSVYEYANR